MLVPLLPVERRSGQVRPKGMDVQGWRDDVDLAGWEDNLSTQPLNHTRDPETSAP